MFTYIACEHIHLAPAAQLSVKFCLIVNLPTSSTGTATFSLIIEKLFDTCHVSSTTALARELNPLEAPFCQLMILGFCG